MAAFFLSKHTGFSGDRNAQVFNISDIVQTATTTFTTNEAGILRVEAGGADTTLTVNGYALTVKLGGTDAFGVKAGQLITVS